MALIVLLLAGCAEEGKGGGETGLLGGDPAIALDTSDVDFGALVSGERGEERVSIESVGEGLLIVDGIALEDETYSFSLHNPPDGLELMPGEAHGVLVAFTPKDEGWIEAVFTVSSNDPDAPEASVTLGGEGLYGHLEISPDPLVMGPIEAGCQQSAALTLTNVGGDDLTISAVSPAGSDALAFGWGFDLPLVLAPGESRELEVTFSPEGEGEASAEVAVSSDELAGQRAAQVTGESTLPPPVTDALTLPEHPSDLAVVVDQTESMDEAQARLAAAFPAFVDRAAALGLDWRLSVWHGEGGCTSSGLLDADTADLEARFSAAVSSFLGVGDYLRLNESMLTVAAMGAERLGKGQCNAGLRREGALFHALLVSDEADQGGDGWASYVERVRAGAGGEVRISAVAGPLPEGCEIAAAGEGYYEAAEETGGLFLELCEESWDDHLVALAELSAGYTDTFPLSEEPLSEDDIEVSVNGEALPGGWSYLPEANAVLFEGALPGDTVAVTYTPAPVCR